MSPMPTVNRIEKEVAAIGDLAREALVEYWAKAYGCPPPKGIGRGLLEKSAAWHLQAKNFGGLTPASRRAFRAYSRAEARAQNAAMVAVPPGDDAAPAVMKQPGANRPAKHRALRDDMTLPPPPLLPGTRLMREWNGRMHIVDVTEHGLIFDGKTFRSLSAIARRITGARWSGPRFFGLPT